MFQADNVLVQRNDFKVFRMCGNGWCGVETLVEGALKKPKDLVASYSRYVASLKIHSSLASFGIFVGSTVCCAMVIGKHYGPTDS